MDNFIDHMILVCTSGAAIIAVLGIWAAIGEQIMKHTNLSDKLAKFLEED